VDELLARADLGLHLAGAWRVVLAGEPNVGKSSLINALVGYRRAIVYRTAGTTRDLLTATTAVDGWPVELADTAGLRATEDPLERAGVRLAEGAMAGADLVLQVVDARQPPAAWPARSAADGPPLLLVANKIDLVAADWPGQAALPISALTGAGIDRLLAAIGERLVPAPPPAGAAVPFTGRQVAALREAEAALRAGAAPAAVAALERALR
jgi:tRNA modification GTPase